ncbi:hypothetical protein ANN_20318 [Periplaneta americana]|uniref:DUF4817 domain-containing protein n=1 Tax=Periplaneta americana TaxID=6978 RepID=A0ABQ8SD12_PERAM|nr:hypothetical protein ANN_20318 [Periplaneta americana]
MVYFYYLAFNICIIKDDDDDDDDDDDNNTKKKVELFLVEKGDRALLVKLFYQNGSNSNAALREYRRQKQLRRGPMSSNGLKNMMERFEERDEFGVAPGTA